MNIPDKDSPLWPAVRIIFGTILVTVLLWANYNQVDTRDAWTIAYFILGATALEIAKRVAAPPV